MKWTSTTDGHGWTTHAAHDGAFVITEAPSGACRLVTVHIATEHANVAGAKRAARDPERQRAVLGDAAADSRGRTLEQQRAACAEIAARHGREIDGRRLTIGRLFHTKRRWSWAERWEKSLAPTTFDDGSRFEPVEFAT